MKKNLTDLTVKRLKVQSIRYDVWDARVPNLGIRVFPSGIKSFFLLYYLHKRKRRTTLGRYPELSLSGARQLAFEHKLLLAKGEDTQPVTKTDFRTALDQFFKLHVEMHNKPNTQRTTKSLLVNECLPIWRKMPVEAITRAEINKVLDKMVARGSAGGANNLYSAISKFFNWCVGRGIIEASPFPGVQRPPKKNTVDRTLSEHEIKAVWENTDYYPFGTIVRLLMLTGCRRAEISAMKWSWISIDAITVPSENTKNGREHVLPITPLMRSILETIPTLDGFLFPARGNSRNSFSGFGKCKARLDKELHIPHWTLHDLRRTLATQMAKLEIQPHIIERVLNHATGSISGVAAIYNRHAYKDEMKGALTVWHREICVLSQE